MKTRLLILSLLSFLSFNSHCQTGNLGHFDNRRLHFGIQVGYTLSKFDLNFNEDPTMRQSLQGVTSYFAPGFHISAICPDLRLNKWFNLRLVPGVTLITREVSYAWESGYASTHSLVEHGRNVESVYGEIPIELKFRSMRYGNFRRASYACSPTTFATAWAWASMFSCIT